MINLKKTKLEDDQIIFYQSPNGSMNIEVMYAEDNVWLPQKKIADLFGTTPQNITQHIKSIYLEREIEKRSTCKDFLQVQQEGPRKIKRNIIMYSLEVIIAVGYRVNSERGTEFRQWATEILKSYIYRGYALDDNRMKYGTRFSARYFDELYEEIKDIRTSERRIYQKITDIYATSIDYSPRTFESKQFFATVQNKLHFAITGQTAAEIISQRVSSKKNKMGLTSWRRSPKGKIMTMKDWIDKLNAFLKFSEYDILNNLGRISHEVAEELALGEYEKYRTKQDKKYISDFDIVVSKIRANLN